MLSSTERVAAGPPISVRTQPRRDEEHRPRIAGNPLACAAANASLDLFETGAWKADVARIAAGLKAGLEPCRGAPSVAHVRVMGAIGVVEFERPVDVADLSRRSASRSSHACGTTGALALGNPSPANSGPSPNTQYLSVSATSCLDSDTYLLNPGETFYVWARLGVVHSSFGVTDALNTFNVTIALEYQAQVQAELAPALAAASGENLDIAVGGIPEPSTWAMMILGFGAAGTAVPRRRRLLPVA